MTFKYFEWEAAATKDRKLSAKHVAEFFFDNDTQAYRFTRALLLVKKKTVLRLRDCPDDLPAATWKRYLDFGVQVGLLQFDNLQYALANRFTPALKNFGAYATKWIQDGPANENPGQLFPEAKKGIEKPRRGKT